MLRVGQITQLFSVGVWLAAIVGALACIWAMRRTGFLVVAVSVPFGIPLVQSYGGEVIYRVYLYSLPLMVAFIAWGIVTRIPIERRARFPQPTILAATVCLAFTAGFLVARTVWTRSTKKYRSRLLHLLDLMRREAEDAAEKAGEDQ